MSVRVVPAPAASPTALTTAPTAVVIVVRGAPALLCLQRSSLCLKGPDRFVVNCTGLDDCFLVERGKVLQIVLERADESFVFLGETIITRWVGWCMPRVQLLY